MIEEPDTMQEQILAVFGWKIESGVLQKIKR
jgi:hypothetical protein